MGLTKHFPVPYHLTPDIYFSHLTFLRATAYSAYMLRQFRPSVCLSVTRVHCIQTAEHVIEILSLSDRPIILVFRDQGFLRKSDGFIP